MSIRGHYIRGYSRPVPPAPLLRPGQLVPGWDGRRTPLALGELSSASEALWRLHKDTFDLPAPPIDRPDAVYVPLELRTPDFTYGAGVSWILSGVASTLLDPQSRTTLVQLTLARHFKIRPCYREGMSLPLYPVQYLGCRMIRPALIPCAPFFMGEFRGHLSELRANFPTLFPSPDR